MHKPYKGRIYNWQKVNIPADALEMLNKDYGENGGLGYMIAGFTTKEPHLGTFIRTSYVVRHNEKTGLIHTRNSRYYVVGKEKSGAN